MASQALRALSTSIAAAVLLLAGGGPLHAQVWTPAEPPADTSSVRPELRLDGFGGRAAAVHAGAGISVRAGNYVRVGLNAGGGPSFRDSVRNVAHADLTARFMVDPFRQQRIGVSLGGGVGARHQDDRLRAFALLFVDAEAGRSSGWMPFMRVGVGSGARVTAGIRRTATFYR
ncbi:MAG: hypothetical protein H0X64_00150 [Gemmatimonadaceae bacterium]|nr:hypothetical protein [Gemmatimonadaceae bacterium]